jgi:hypothetical protein
MKSQYRDDCQKNAGARIENHLGKHRRSVQKGEKIPDWMKEVLIDILREDASYAYSPTKGSTKPAGSSPCAPTRAARRRSRPRM